MAHLPSYQEATSQDWLEVVSPYIPLRDYRTLCLVSKRFYEQFAPRLYNSPLAIVRALGLDPNDDLAWFFKFLRRMKSARRVTAALVATLDFREFAVGVSDFYSDPTDWDISQTFRHFPSIFPNLCCVLLDGHSEFDPSPLSKPDGPSGDLLTASGSLLLLSMVQCRTPLPAGFFQSPYLAGLVYLDLSHVPGSLKSLLSQGSFGSSSLPMLRILKARGRELDDRTAILLFEAFTIQLWSLDLGDNGLTDGMLDCLMRESFPVHALQSDTHFSTEGKISLPDRAGSTIYGPFTFIEESGFSAGLSHPGRYFADAPSYSPAADAPTPEGVFVRSDGRTAIWQDTAENARRVLGGDWDRRMPDASEVYLCDLCQRHGGITHLYLNGNSFSSAGIQRVLRLSPGQLEHFECDSMTFQINCQGLPKWLPNSSKLYGFVGGAHLFRPVISSNLRVLRIHHSLVTQTPTLEAEDLTSMARLWVAETHFRDRVELAYPQAFVPDMNPRLYSLTLTNIPRYSTGGIMNKLIGFLRLAAAQERAIADATQSNHRRAPTMLQGLRHIRLEFDPDPTEELSTLADGDVFDSEELASMAAKEFSFFGESGWASSSPATDSQSERKGPADAGSGTTPPDELKHPPFTETAEHHLEHTGTWAGRNFTIPVWIGPGVLGQHIAVNEYMRALRHPELRADVVPASPSHVAAGVPPGSYIYQAAWDAMLTPTDISRPTKSDLRSMQDVLAAIKKYRLDTKAVYMASQARGDSNTASSADRSSHPHWNGRLEIVFNNGVAHNSSDYWR
ncbi:Leucine rich repeat domain containing protein [Pleurostoma richardsiae]|uniref:Leucine rich repeat domain containing protein n=1 Tax=Pleurostoma richardsiae TaxID=41990 RepID=A0AA38RIP0_9PEZI|nr:Leucine rich repeat domain containing protein [Pleurostoma richardsiae]